MVTFLTCSLNCLGADCSSWVAHCNSILQWIFPLGSKSTCGNEIERGRQKSTHHFHSKHLFSADKQGMYNIRGHTFMTPAVGGGGGPQNADQRKEVAWILYMTRGEGVKKLEIFADVT